MNIAGGAEAPGRSGASDCSTRSTGRVRTPTSDGGNSPVPMDPTGDGGNCPGPMDPTAMDPTGDGINCPGPMDPIEDLGSRPCDGRASDPLCDPTGDIPDRGFRACDPRASDSLRDPIGDRGFRACEVCVTPKVDTESAVAGGDNGRPCEGGSNGRGAVGGGPALTGSMPLDGNGNDEP